MTKPSRLGVWTGAATLVGTLGLLPSLPAIAAEELEEVVVTGSYIKRDSFDSSSPLTVVDQTAIAENATPNLGEVLVNQTFNYGTDFQTNTYAARSQGGNLSAANLRGLGTAATLQLIDGKRSINSNLNGAIPQVAIERIDILKDGASAIYGTDAVAGVVNLITRKNFSGSKFSAFYQRDKDDQLHEQVYEFLAGSDTDDGHIAMALSYKSRGELEQTERPEYLRKGFERSSTGNPGDWLVPDRDPVTGALTGTATRMRDPGCGAATAQSPGGTDVGKKGNWLSGDPSGANCRFHFGETWNFINPQDEFSFWGNYQFQFSDSVANELELTAVRLITDSRGSPQNPGGRTEEFPVVRGDHPGNPYRAFADQLTVDTDGDTIPDAGNGIIDAGEQLYAQDADADGVPDRGTVDANGDGVPDVILAASPFDPASGIPFNEDVDVIALRIFGKIGLLPGANQPVSLNADGSNTGNWTFDTVNYRLVDTMTYTVPNSGWEVALSGIWERIETILENKNTSQTALEAGLRGQLKATQYDAGYSYWNPFATQALNCVDRVCSYSGTPDFPNTVDVLNAVNIQSNNVTNTDYWTIDVIATGDLAELPAGTMGGAFGAEYRKISIDADIDSARNQCDWHEGGCQYDWTGKQDVYAMFFELAIPVVQNLDAQVAARYTDYGGSIGNSLDPKVAVLWQPLDILSVRASYSTAFIAPTLTQLFSAEACGLQTVNDQLTNDNSGTFRVGCLNSNPDLIPESADVWNIGASMSLLDGNLNFGVDYSEYKFSDRISSETVNNVLRADYQAFLASGGDSDPASGDTNGDGISNSADAWILSGSDPAIFRDSSGLVTRVKTSRVNAPSMLNRSVDYYARYNLSLDRWGDFVFNLGMTQALEYSYDLGTPDPLDFGDGVGQQNEQVVEIPPMPEWRINASVNWFMGNHAAAIKLRWLDKVKLQFNSGGLVEAATSPLQGLAYFQKVINGDTNLEAMLYTDINYKYTFPSLLGNRETTIEVGANNVFDEFPKPFFNLGGIETYLHDIRGRMMYIRINQDI